MKKRLIALLLVLVTVLGMLPATALAAGSEEEALGEVNIYNGGQKLAYLSINGRIREQIYTYFNYVDSQGRTKEIPRTVSTPTPRASRSRSLPVRASSISLRRRAMTRRSWVSSPTDTPPVAFRS